MTDLVLALHGTRSQAGTLAAEELRKAVAARLPGVEVVIGFVDIHEVLLADVVAARGPSIVVPAFLTAGYHVDHDINLALRAAQGRAVATGHLDGAVVDALVDRVHQAGGPGDAVVLASIGSARPESNREVLHTARRLENRLGVPVRPGFLYASEPKVGQVVNDLRAGGCERITVATHALFPGRYQQILDGLDVVVADPIGIHPVLVDTIVSRYRQAVRQAA